MIKAVLVVTALAGCLGDEYRCATDADCDMGVAGRCELDHHCTQYDGTCPLDRRYTSHSGSDTGQCFAENVTPLDLCAPGQPPADNHDACAAAVCGKTPSCCTTGWVETCVQQAQLLCPIHCDTRIAVIAVGGAINAPNPVAVFDLRYDGMHWTAVPRTDRGSFLQWLAPAPGTTEPRLAGMNAPNAAPQFFIDDTTPVTRPIAPDRHYDTATTVDFDRSGHDTIMLTSYDSPDRGTHELIDLTRGDVREIQANNAPAETWGDDDGDGFPDGVAANGASAAFRFLRNTADEHHARVIDDSVTANANSGNPYPPVRSFSWADLDANGRMDLVQFGSNIQFHMGQGTTPLRDTPMLRLDCEPIVSFPTSGVCNVNNQGDFSLAGTTVPTSKGMTIVASVDNTGTTGTRTRNLYNIELKFGPIAPGTISPIGFGPPGCASPCDAPIRAVVARDLNGDGVLDLVAIDAKLGVWVGLGIMTGGYGPMTLQPVVLGTGQTAYPLVRINASGAPR